MSITSKTKRRNFLKGVGGAAAVTAAAPFIWIPRMSKARLDIPASRHNHLIMINLDGGARSVPMFNGSVSTQYNPFMNDAGTSVHGAAQGVPASVEWSPGGLFDYMPYTDTQVGFGQDMPSLPMIADEICVLGTVDHTPGAAVGEGNHNNARNWISSGMGMGGAGIMSLIYANHKNYAEDAGGNPIFPPVTIGTGAATTPFSVPDGPIAPVEVPSFSEFEDQSGEDAGEQPAWARNMEEGLDNYIAGSRSARDRELIRRLSNGKSAVETFKAVFTDPAVKVESEPNAGVGLTNAQLGTILGTSQLGRDLALSLRFLQAGSASVLVGHNGWDTHSNESTLYVNLANELARAFAGLNFALKQLSHPEGGTYWDHTMVIVHSEFGRDNLQGNGFNSGGGSDHTGGAGSRYQAFPYMGGQVTMGGGFYGRTDASTMEPMAGEPIFSTTQHLATALAYLDIDTSNIWEGIDPMTAIFNGEA